MQNYEQFWVHGMPMPHSQLVVEWDDFIHHFSAHVRKYASVELNHQQRLYIKQLIDPENKNQVYKSGFLIFIADYWSLPSNRTNLFKSRIKLETKSALKKCFQAPEYKSKLDLSSKAFPKAECIFIKIKYLSENGLWKESKFEYENDSLYSMQADSLRQQIPTRELDYISVGYSQGDIRLPDAVYVNTEHFKLIKLRSKVKVKPVLRLMLEEEKPEFRDVTEWYLRDVAKSSRLYYMMDQPQKCVILQPNLTIRVGASNSYLIRIDQIGDGLSQSVPQSLVLHLEKEMNEDRFNYLGDIDETVPQKFLIPMNSQDLGLRQMEDMLKAKQFYPSQLNKKSNSSQHLTLHLSLIDSTTNQVTKYTIRSSQCKVGNSTQCQIRIDSFDCKPIECILQSKQGLWIANAPSIDKKSRLGISIATQTQIDEMRASNRFKLKKEKTHAFMGNYLLVELYIRAEEEKDEENY